MSTALQPGQELIRAHLAHQRFVMNMARAGWAARTVGDNLILGRQVKLCKLLPWLPPITRQYVPFCSTFAILELCFARGRVLGLMVLVQIEHNFPLLPNADKN
jgi:hypothetical protein